MLRCLTVLTRGAAFAIAAATLRTLWAQFVHGQLAIAIFIKLLQRGGSIGDFAGVDHAVVVGIERFHQWRRWRAASVHSTGSAAGALARRALAIGRLTAGRR